MTATWLRSQTSIQGTGQRIGQTAGRKLTGAGLAVGLLAASFGEAGAQASSRDSIGAFLMGLGGAKVAQSTTGETTKSADKKNEPERDPREGEQSYEQARRLMSAIDAILKDTAKNRSEARKLPSKDEFMVPPIWTETKEDRERRIRNLMDSALGIVTDVPVVDIQKRIEERRSTIRQLEERIVALKEKQLTAPKDSILPGVVADTVDSLARDIEETKNRITGNREDIGKAKSEIRSAMEKAGIKLGDDQLDLLLDGVLSGDLVRLVAVFNSAKVIDQQLAKLMGQTGDNMSAARRYFAMHAALFAILVHAQDSLIDKIDTQYLPKLSAIGRDISAAERKTQDLLRAENRPDQRRVLEANKQSQKLASQAAQGYRRYLMQQREQIAVARKRAAHDLRIADNTYETVEASYQLKSLMRDTTATFEAIQKLEAPTFEQIFKNEELRREFENLTKKLEAPAS